MYQINYTDWNAVNYIQCYSLFMKYKHESRYLSFVKTKVLFKIKFSILEMRKNSFWKLTSHALKDQNRSLKILLLKMFHIFMKNAKCFRPSLIIRRQDTSFDKLIQRLTVKNSPGQFVQSVISRSHRQWRIFNSRRQIRVWRERLRPRKNNKRDKFNGL